MYRQKRCTRPIRLIYSVKDTRPLRALSRGVPRRVNNVFIGFRTLVLVASFCVTMGHGNSCGVTTTPFRFRNTPNLSKGVPTMDLIRGIFRKGHRIVNDVIFHIRIVISNSGTRAMNQGCPTRVTTNLCMFASRTKRVLSGCAINLTLFGRARRFLGYQTIGGSATMAIIGLFYRSLGLQIPNGMVVSRPPLINSTITFHHLIVNVEGASMLSYFMGLRGGALLSLHEGVPTVRRI